MQPLTFLISPDKTLRIPATVCVSPQRSRALVQNGKPVPAPFHVQALIDTGATLSCVDPAVIRHLQISPIDTKRVHTPTSGLEPEELDQYDVGLTLCPDAPEPFEFSAIPVLASHLNVVQGFHLLLGLDVLEHFLIHYDGPGGTFSLLRTGR